MNGKVSQSCADESSRLVHVLLQLRDCQIDDMIATSTQSFATSETDNEFRVMKVEEVSSVEGSDKLIQLKMRRGKDFIQIRGGLAEMAGNSDIKRANLFVLAHFEPRNNRGTESQGMILVVALDGYAEPDQLDKNFTNFLID